MEFHDKQLKYTFHCIIITYSYKFQSFGFKFHFFFIQFQDFKVKLQDKKIITLFPITMWGVGRHLEWCNG